jgi:YfiH family protein
MERITYGPLAYYRCRSLPAEDGVVHGIFTRLGGHSGPPWESLNTGHTVGDVPSAVLENHRAICEALGVEMAHLVSPHQVHGTRVAAVGLEHRGQVIADTDALITDVPGVVLMLRFADCTPLWLYDRRLGAIGLAHAGWRGTVADVAGATVRAMQVAFGCHPSDLVGCIGPSIGPCCYEVGTDVAQAVEHTFGQEGASLLRPQGPGKWHLDMWAANRRQLAEAGVKQIEVGGACTACNTEEWFSHRAEHGRTGRMGALITLRE